MFVSFLFIAAASKAADWPTFGHDPQRTGWAYEETMLSPENVSTLELKWKTKVKNEFRMLSALTVPVVAIGVPTLKGVRDVVYVAGSGGRMDLTEIGKPLVRPVRLEEVRPFPE